jgi:hypothetical protein
MPMILEKPSKLTVTWEWSGGPLVIWLGVWIVSGIRCPRPRT